MIALALLPACSGGGSSTAPTPTTYTLSGSLSAVNGGQPLNGTATANGTITASIANGAFLLTLPGTVQGSVALTAQGAGIIDRAVFVTAGQPRSVAFDAIALDGRFDLDFYRALARNRLEDATLQPLRRWLTVPRFYLRTVDEAGAPIDPHVLDAIEATLRDGVPEWTGGVLGTPTVERGTETKEGISGYVTVKVPSPAGAKCGRATVAQSGGWIELELYNQACRCGGFTVAPHSIRHELGHALGFWHTDRADDLMWGGVWGSLSCDLHPTDREKYHAAIVYHRQPGNLDPDRESATSTPLYRAIF